MSSSIFIDPPHASAESTAALPSNRVQPAPPTVASPAVRPAPGIWEALLWTLGFMMMTQIIPSVILAICSLDETGNVVLRNEALLPTLLGGQILGVCFSLLLLRLRVGRDWLGAIQVRRPALLPCLLAVACVPALMLVGFGVETLVESVTGVKEPTAELVAAGIASYPLWFCVLVVAVGASVNEEFFCRGFLGRGLVGRYGIFVGVLLTSAIFGAIHLNLPQGIWAFILGCFLHLAYRMTGSLWAPLLLHFLNNAIAVILVSALPGFEPAPWQWMVASVVAFTIAIPSAWALYRLREEQAA